MGGCTLCYWTATRHLTQEEGKKKKDMIARGVLWWSKKNLPKRMGTAGKSNQWCPSGLSLRATVILSNVTDLPKELNHICIRFRMIVNL